MSRSTVGVVKMSSALQVNPDIGLQELLQVSNSEQWSIQYSPFLTGPGGQVGGTIIRQAAPWKGMSEAELEQHHPDVYDGLQEAKQMASQQSGTSGVAVIRQGGQMKIVSQAAANLAQEGQDDSVQVVADNLPGYSAALDELAARGGQAALPTVA